MSSSASSSGSAAAEVGAGSVTIATDCAWEQVTKGDTCYVEPRSCYDCLNTALSNGQECVLTPYGLCQNISAYDYTKDYRRAQSAFTYPIHYNYFPEVNTTYCEPNDSVCKSCQETTFTVGNNNPSVYCTGTDNCVCVAICESESWWNDTLARLAAYLEENNETTTCPLAANSSSTSAEADASASSGITKPATKDAYAADDECMWYQNSTKCETPRTCYDCLNTALYSGQKCTITPGGYCTTIDQYDYTLDYRRVYSDSAAHYFPSTNTTYCEHDDAACTKCRTETFLGAYADKTNLSEYCVGENGCVCVAFCESPYWETVVKEEGCEATTTTDTSGRSGIPAIGIAAIIMVGVLLALSAILQLFNMFRARPEVEAPVLALLMCSTPRVMGSFNLLFDTLNGPIKSRQKKALFFESGGYFSLILQQKAGGRSLSDVPMSASGSTSSAVVTTPAPTASAVYTKASQNVCMWKQQSSDACDSPRSCYDCLNSSPGDGVQCVISSAGLCTTMAEYVWQEDYRRNSSAAAAHYFPAANTTYCEDSDPVCVACEASQFVKSASGATQPSQFCVGAGGCVCVGFCESPVYSTKVSSAYCATLNATTTVSVMGISVDDIVTIVILCFTIPVIAYLGWVRYLRKKRQAREEAYRNRPPVNGPLLPLVGWKKYRADLMANQTSIVGMAGADDVVAIPIAAAATGEANVQEGGAAAPSAPLTNLQVAPLSIEFEDPQHPLTAVTSTGRRRSSIDNTNIVRHRPSQPISSNEEGDEDDDEEDEIDARATPASTLRSGSTGTAETISASSCSSKTTASQDGECFLEPRTCSECLAETPTTGETCLLTEKGLCLSVEEYEDTLASDGGTYYVAGNATYCAGANSSSSGSVGADCVSLDYCESSTWLSYARQRLPLIVLAVNASTPEGCVFATDTVNAVTGGGAESSSDDASSSSSSAPSSSRDTLASEDKCTWYQNTTLCSTPRTCYDCLNTAADSGEACTITPDGYCATLSTTYNYKLDFRSISSSGAANGYYFPSTNTTYCEPSDQACTNCGMAGSSSNSASYCLGSDGCLRVYHLAEPLRHGVPVENLLHLPKPGGGGCAGRGGGCVACAADGAGSEAAPKVRAAAINSVAGAAGLEGVARRAHRRQADNATFSVDAGDSGKSVSSNTGDSCTWYDDGACSRPRTCADCLNVLLSSDECAVDPSGVCVSMTQYESYLANRYYYTPLQRYFPSSQYSYCSANDSACATCAQEWTANFASTGSAGGASYCTGTDGCVCIADCEVPDWQETVINKQCAASSSGGDEDSGTSMVTRITVSIFVGVAVAVLLAFATWGVRRFVNRWNYEPDGESEMSGVRAVGNDVGDEPTPVTKTESSNTADSCTWYANASCNRPRTCYDCLNVQVSSGECAIMPNGMCVSLADYSHFISTQEEFGIYYKYYPSSKYTYCSADDSACSACAAQWISDYKSKGTVGTPTYCTGFDGCVCLARCEIPDWSSSILTDQCSSSGSSTSSSQTSTASRIGFALALGVVFGVLLGLWGIKLLLQVEQEAFGGAEMAIFASQARNENSANADAANTAALEEGDVYLPVSPSQVVRRPRDVSGRLHTKMAPQAADANSSAASGDAGFATETKTTSSTSGDSCTWYAGESCVQPRTGYDCLNALLSTDECAIDPNGACVSVSVYEQYLSNKAYYEPLSRYFPASNYTYCSASDAVCSTCIAEWTSNYDTTGSAGSQTYCTGSDGCVCVAAAEVPSWKQTVIEYQCGSSGDSDSVSTSQEFSSGTRICIILAMCVGAVMIFSVFAVRRCIRVASPRRSGTFRCCPALKRSIERVTHCCILGYAGPGSIIRPPPSGPQLSLTGWKYLREKLIETEHTFVKGDTARLDATARSAEALAEAPTVTVEVVSAPERRPSSPAPFEAQYMMAPIREYHAGDRHGRGFVHRVFDDHFVSEEAAQVLHALYVIGRIGCPGCGSANLLSTSSGLELDPSTSTAGRRPARSPRGPQLTLSGWKSMREKLIETEQGNGTPSAGPAGVMRIQLSAAEGTSVIVEEGEGFRPESPSNQYRSQRPEDVAPALAMLR
ncbi:unnamed protein product [Phytophthora lilii]|uniref:Unnamed protein product n=1 Tax=Phytophthora lilii TaxID=2077276 RepID=A0A9W6TSK9_9STRA|nr:unnamed protein product [Phytophthora lilii]